MLLLIICLFNIGECQSREMGPIVKKEISEPDVKEEIADHETKEVKTDIKKEICTSCSDPIMCKCEFLDPKYEEKVIKE